MCVNIIRFAAFVGDGPWERLGSGPVITKITLPNGIEIAVPTCACCGCREVGAARLAGLLGYDRGLEGAAAADWAAAARTCPELSWSVVRVQAPHRMLPRPLSVQHRAR
jgi:hypothetical protein